MECYCTRLNLEILVLKIVLESSFLAQLYLAPFPHNLTRIASTLQMFCHYPKAVLSGVCRTPTRSPPSMEQAQLSWPGRKWCEFLKESPIESSSITTPISGYPACTLNKHLQGIQQRSILWDPTVRTRYIVIQTYQQTCVYTVSMFGGEVQNRNASVEPALW